MRSTRAAILAGSAAAALLAAAAAPSAMREAPPAGHTGGFGEPTCHACHFEAPPNSGAGRLTLHGLPAEWTPAATYDVQVILEDGRMAVAGFQLAARFADGAQAGTLEPADPDPDQARTRVVTWRDIQYAGQTWDGAVPDSAGRARWSLRWTAPAAAAGPVSFHAAANAANDDDSPLGDRVYTAEHTIPPSAAPQR